MAFRGVSQRNVVAIGNIGSNKYILAGNDMYRY